MIPSSSFMPNWRQELPHCHTLCAASRESVAPGGLHSAQVEPRKITPGEHLAHAGVAGKLARAKKKKAHKPYFLEFIMVVFW